MLLRVRLIKKLARFLNGVDLEELRVGECVDLPAAVARMLLSEGWAELEQPLSAESPIEKRR
jgi:hypothetical protein